MNYRHAYHAGNFADVAKHLALVCVLLHLRKKEPPFAVIDTHAGRGAYDLAGEEAGRTGEAETGIKRLTGLKDAPPALVTYLNLAGQNDTYPGSPLIGAKMLRAQDRLIAFEKHPEEAAVLKTVLAPFRKAHAEVADGYARLAAILPPPERRGVVLIDPPYEAEDEFECVARSFAAAYRRFATGIFLIWFPIKSRAEADGFCGEVLFAGAQKVLRLDVSLGAFDAEKLTGAGLLVVGPPYGFEARMRECFDLVLPRMGNEGASATARFDWLAGSE